LNTPVTQATTTRWQPHKRYLRSAVPAELCGWLLDTASLTLRLQQLCAGRFEVRVLSQRWGRPALNEARVLGMRPECRAIIRQVQLLCNGQPWIYARTVIPVTSLRGRLQRLAHLGTRPLGGVLFADPGMQRGIVELACIRPGQALYRAAVSSTRLRPPAIWGRRSVFTIAGLPLLVSEVFLPAFPAASGSKPLWKCR
jgi:chorismate--pyruvate lyase